jgi:succinate dehydrogenase/fumarate reductase flavoprotein subunit
MAGTPGHDEVNVGRAEMERQDAPPPWDRDADVVVIGSGATGLPAAIFAREAGASVIVVEAQPHIGGHAITSGGNLPLGGGTSYQKKYGVEDSPDLFFRDLTDWSVIETNGFPPYRYNDREIIRAFADNSVASFEFLLAHGVRVIDRPPNSIGHEIGVSVPRTMQIDVADWPMVHTGKSADPNDPEIRAGAGLIRPLEAAARKAGVEILLEHRMTAIHREAPRRGRVLGIAVDHKGAVRNIRARKAVVIATGGSTGNVNFRRMFDPRLTEEYCGLAGMPWSDQDASARCHRLPVRLCQRALASRQRGVRQSSRHRAPGQRLARRHLGQHARQAFLRRDRRPL